MQLLCISVTHHTTPVELRECISLSTEVLENAYLTSPIHQGSFESINELAILSTCNRLEVYALVTLPNGIEESSEAIADPVLAYLRDVLDIPINLVEPYSQVYLNGQAARHLFLVAAGLDSIAIGETQILGQVERALDSALKSGTARHVLSSLFRAAIHTGKRTRSETEIGRHPINISTIGVHLAEVTMGSLKDREILVIGAGKMGGLTINALRDCGAKRVTITNRTMSHAIEMAERFGSDVMAYEQLPEGIAKADLVFTSTAAPLPILHPDIIGHAMQQRSERPLVIVDLAVPRNTDPRVKEVVGVHLFDMDDLQRFTQSSIASYTSEVANAKAIVEDEVTEYEKLLHILPFIGELHKKVEEIRQQELERTLRRLQNTDPLLTEQLILFSRSLVRKILHEPTMYLRTESDPEKLGDYVEVLAHLFNLGSSEYLLTPKESTEWRHPSPVR